MIAVLSDSHVPLRADEIPEKFIEKVKEADLTVHCGDFEAEEVYNRLDQHGELIGVKGNCDRFQIQNSAMFERNGIKFGVYHGTGISPRGRHPTLVNIADEKMDIDVLLHGHTHHQEAVKKNGKILLNPGSCTGVGGGSAESDNPKMMMMMMILEGGQRLEVELIELVAGELKTETKEFRS